jgi:Tol biopolymer transport system component
MNRGTYSIGIGLLSLATFLAIGSGAVSSDTRPRAPYPAAVATAPERGGSPAAGQELVRRPIGTARPPLDLRRELPVAGRLAAPFTAPPQAFNMTTFPRPPATGAPTASRDQHPDWSADERSIVFASDRTNRDGTAAGARFHLWQASSDGAALAQLTGAGAEGALDQLYPAFSPENGRVAYAGQPANGAPAQLFVLDTGSGARTQLTGPGAGVGLGAELVDVQKPTWSPAGDRIAFAARPASGQAFQVFLIEVGTRAVARLTHGAEGVESVDPIWSPDGHWIAFASTGKATSADGAFIEGGSDHDLWMTQSTPPARGRQTIHVTQGPPDDREPAFSPRVADDPSGLGTGQEVLLAFASNRAGTYDIWWIVALDAKGLIVAENSVENPVRLLLTNDANPADGAPLGRSQERYPTWARFVQSDSVAYQTDATGNGDIWQASLLDRVAPAVEAVDEAAGEIVRVTPRQTAPGTPVRIEARVRDLQSGVDSVWAQFKDPDGKFQGTQDAEHKLFRRVTKMVGDTKVELFEEYECEGVSAASGGGPPRYFRGTRAATPVASYVPVNDDRFAFTGTDRPPLDGSSEERPAHWLRLWDDGPAPGGHEPPESVAGDSVFSGEWTTPTDGSDYYLDVIVYDRATDPLGRFPGRGNWKVYDNIGGFSTAPFVASRNVLAVMDHTLGQKILGAQIVRTASGASVQLTYPSMGVESYILDHDEKLRPVIVIEEMDDQGNPVITKVPIPGWRNNLGSTSLAGDNYDIWRVLARGPIDPGTLASYGPVTDRQPAPVQPGNPRPRVVAERAVLWAAPFAGNIWVGRGSITDPQTQATLAQFVQRGGRLWVSGQDIAWALTAGGTTANPFLTSVLRAQYAADVPPADWFNPTRGALLIPAALPEHPIAVDPLGSFAAQPTSPLFPVDLDSYPFLGTNDVLQTGESVAVYVYSLGPGTEEAPVQGVPALLAVANESGEGRVIFSSVGLEQVGRHYEGEGEALACFNYRGRLTHAGLCWLTHFGVQGRVTDTSRQPLAGVIVRAIGDPAQGAVGTALTNADGTYLIRGLSPRPGGYTLEASLSGFLFQHERFGSEHGLGRRVTRDLVMSRVGR